VFSATTTCCSRGSDGTWRIVDVEGKSPEYPQVKVQIRSQ
jgi:hypothetical protein